MNSTGTNISPTDSRISITFVQKDAFIFLGIFLTTRLALLFFLSWIVGGNELSDDVDMHMEMIRAPFDILLGASQVHSQHPPFLPLFEALFGLPLQLLFSDFYTIRIMSILYEVLAVYIFWIILLTLNINEERRKFLCYALLIFPAGWMSSTIMGQDEMIGAFFISMTFLFLIMGRPAAAILVCSIGVVAAKIYLLIPLTVMVVTLPEPIFRKKLLAGFVPIATVYSWLLVLSWIQNVSTPLISFTPNIDNSVNLWPYLSRIMDFSSEEAKGLSGIIALLVGISPLAFWMFRKNELKLTQQAALSAGMLFIVYATFYHINPEYYVIAIPLYLTAFNTKKQVFFLLFVTSLPWLANFFYGVDIAMSNASLGGKKIIADMYQSTIPIDPALAWNICLFLTFIFTLVAGVIAVNSALKITHKISS